MDNPYTKLPEKAFWKTAVANKNFLDIEDLWSPKYSIQKDHKIATFGSCFAQHFGKALRQREFGWFDAEPAPDSFSIKNKSIIHLVQNDNEITKRLIEILNAAKKLNPDFLEDNNGFEVTTELEFPNSWGLGTSSTLINNIANWAKVDAYKLLELTFGGSGYDVACAQNSSAITYQIKRPFEGACLERSRKAQSDITKERKVKEVIFNPEFSDNLFFIHLNKKQNSREGIERYKSSKSDLASSISEINSITNQIINCDTLSHFEDLITQHEKIISNIIKLKPIKDDLFYDYKGAIKSLGAWGGDFILVTGTKNDMSYFKNKGYNTILGFNEMVLSSF